jgi:hypothetical protein
MKKVAEILVERSLKKECDNRDELARTAFNRFYYHCFLCVRKLLLSIEPGKKTLSHKSIPEYLKKTLSKRITTRIKSQSEIIPNSKSMAANTRRALQTLAEELEKGYRIRVWADYEPDEAITFNENSFSMQGVTVADARGWVIKVEQNASLLFTIVDQLGGVEDD